MGLIMVLVIGGIVGWLASIVMKTNAQMGLIANIIVGVIGAVIGNYLAGALGMASSGIAGILMAVLGSMVLIGLLKVLGVFK